MNIEEIQALYGKTFTEAQKQLHFDEMSETGKRWILEDMQQAIIWLLSDHTRLTSELAEERAACTIAGNAMDAMRATIDRKDEEIRLLRNVVESDEIICDGFGYGLDYSYARKNLAAFDKEHHA